VRYGAPAGAARGSPPTRRAAGPAAGPAPSSSVVTSPFAPRSLTLRRALLPLLAVLAACRGAVEPMPAPMAPTATLEPALPADVGLDASLPATLDSLARAAVADRTAWGVVIAGGRHGRVGYMHGEGHTDWAPGSAKADAATLYDLASLTKVVATTTAAMILEEAGLLHVDSTVAHYLPEFAAVDSAKRP